MEYLFQLGTFSYISLSEIINVLESESLNYTVLDVSNESLHIEIDKIDPEIFLQFLGGTRSITNLGSDETFEQNIKDYKKREFGKPRVDSKVGLLPSKLAKMMINLSLTKKGVTKVYDPFCGGGTIITEANVMGIKGIGTDLDSQMIKDARANARWMQKEYSLPDGMYEFSQADIRSIETEELKKKGIDAIVSEPYMGNATNQPLRMGMNDQINLKHVNSVIEEALKKASAILETGERAIIIIPRFRTAKGSVETLEISEKYSRFSFRKVDVLKGLTNIDKSHNLLYFRPKAVVLREIFILEKI